MCSDLHQICLISFLINITWFEYQIYLNDKSSIINLFLYELICIPRVPMFKINSIDWKSSTTIKIMRKYPIKKYLGISRNLNFPTVFSSEGYLIIFFKSSFRLLVFLIYAVMQDRPLVYMWKCWAKQESFKGPKHWKEVE